jgi:hypothetical protein
MIRPTKYMNVHSCSLSVAAMILSHLRQLSAFPLTEIEGLVTKSLGEPANSNTRAAINLLFLFGTIRYDDHADALVYIPPSERRRP